MIRRSLIAAMLVACAGVAHAQSGWEARVTAAPNPLPAGKCAAIVVELVDDHGYRRTTLSNGEQIDLRKFTYTTNAAAHFIVRNDPSMWANVCADSSAPPVSTIVTVTLPDGLKGTVQIFLVAKGSPPARAVVYRQQAPLRLPTSPEYAPGFVAGQAQGAAAGGGAGGAAAGGAASGAAGGATSGAAGAAGAAGGAASSAAGGAASSAASGAASSAAGGAASSAAGGAASGAAGGAASSAAGGAASSAAGGAASSAAGGTASGAVGVAGGAPRPISGTVEKLLHPSVSVTTTPLLLVGTYHVKSVFDTTSALSLTGTYQVLSVVETTTALSLTGTYASHPVAGTVPHAVTPKPIPPGAHSP